MFGTRRTDAEIIAALKPIEAGSRAVRIPGLVIGGSGRP
jgi:hypothetical protein